MTIVALAKVPLDREPVARVLSQQLGLPLADARMRAAPEPPTLLARLPDDEARGLASALRVADFAALAVAEPLPGDARRTMPHTLALFPAGVSFTPRTGAPLNIRWEEILVLLRGASAVTTRSETTERSYSVSMAGSEGASVDVRERTHRKTEEQIEQTVFVYARDGRCAVVRDREMNFRCLGQRMQPSRGGNLIALTRVLRESAPKAFYDERLVKLGRRPLPLHLVGGGETHCSSGVTSSTRVSTANGLDVLAETLFQAVRAGLLP